MGDNVVTVILVGAGFVLFSLALFAIALRWGPRRGNFMQPAAALRPPGRWLALGLYVVGALHLLAGVAVWIAGPGFGGLAWGPLLVGIATGLFYVACAKVMTIASAPSHLRRSH